MTMAGEARALPERPRNKDQRMERVEHGGG